MSVKSAIEWTEATWNPVTGCTKVSEGCDHCYAETFSERFRGVPGHPYEQGFDLKLWPERLEMPLRWRKPRLVFVNSMSDLFHDDVPDEFIDEVFRVMYEAERHTFQVLTKRPARMARFLKDIDPLPNVWLGTSVENQKWADVRIPHLLKTPAAVRFLSCEPLLGPIDVSTYLGVEWMDALDGYGHEMFAALNDQVGPKGGLHWVIVGGESGPGARPMHPDWARSLRDQCFAAEVPFFFKQWGEFAPSRRDEAWQVGREFWPVWRYGKKTAGRELDGRTWDEMP